MSQQQPIEEVPKVYQINKTGMRVIDVQRQQVYNVGNPWAAT